MAEREKFNTWLARLRRFWSNRLDALERYLDDLDHKDRLKQPNGKAK
jgi:hypothetical protein